MSPSSSDLHDSVTAVLFIDFQVGLSHPTHFGPSRSNPQVGANAAKLLAAARKRKLHIIHVNHNTPRPGSILAAGSSGAEFEDYARPIDGEPIMTKQVNSAFIGTNLETWLRERLVTKLVVAGVTTDHCVSTSVRMAANLGVVNHTLKDGSVKSGEIILVGDATAAHEKGGFSAELVHKVHLASLNGEFARVVTTEQVLLEMEDIWAAKNGLDIDVALVHKTSSIRKYEDVEVGSDVDIVRNVVDDTV